MHSESVKLALYDIRDNILFAREIIEGFTSQEFAESRLHVYAATRALEIISEASRRLPDDMRDRHSGLPWRSIRDVGNFYRHQYDNVAASYIWETVSTHLPPLLAAVLAEISALET
jgi:uncharacterized protein with HEPN domain